MEKDKRSDRLQNISGNEEKGKVQDRKNDQKAKDCEICKEETQKREKIFLQSESFQNDRRKNCLQQVFKY